MKLLFLGAGSAFTLGADNYQSNMILQTDAGNRLLIDCGSDVRHSLHEAGLSYLDITDVYISHLHADHAGGLEWLAFNSYFDPQYTGKPNLYICDSIIDKLWQHTLKGGLVSLDDQKPSLSAFFNSHLAPSSGHFAWQGTEFSLVPTRHVCSKYCELPSYGLFFNSGKHNVYITTDTQFNIEGMMPYYQKADIIFHDCETVSYCSGVHSNYIDMKTLPAEIKAKIWLYHYNPGELPDAKADGFKGFVKKGQIIEL